MMPSRIIWRWIVYTANNVNDFETQTTRYSTEDDRENSMSRPGHCLLDENSVEVDQAFIPTSRLSQRSHGLE